VGATPQLPRDDLVKWMKGIESQLSLLHERMNNPLANTGLTVPTAGVVECDGTFNVVGTENVSGNLNVSGNETVSGTLNVTGNTVIGGTLSLPAGIINNAALANPVGSDSAFSGASSFALSVAGANIITINKTVPAGFTSAVVTVFGRVAAINSTAATDHLYLSVDVNGAGGNQFGVPVAAGDFNTTGAGYSARLTGLTGGSSNIAAHVYASTGTAAWAANAGNGADLAVTYIWFR
jgi:hypothetical protein